MEKRILSNLRHGGREIRSLIKKKKWLKASQVLRQPQQHHAARKRINKKNTPALGGVSLLTFAILHDAPIDVINAILANDKYTTVLKPEAEELTGMSPLHVACAYGSSFEVIYALIQHDRGVLGLPRTAELVDKCRRTPLHHLMHHLCFPKEVDRGRAIFGSDIFSSMGVTTSTRSGDNNYSDSSSKSFETAPINTSKKLSFPFKKRIKKLPACRRSSPSSILSSSSSMSMNQDELEECMITLRCLAQVGPKAIFCRDIDGRCPIDILHECKASHTGSSRSPSWERADIGCVTLRSETMKYYQSEKAKAERHSSKLEKTASVDGTSSTADGTSVMSGSILSGLSKLEVDSLSLGQMDLSVCSRNGKTRTKWES